jgi:cell division protein FtsQ
MRAAAVPRVIGSGAGAVRSRFGTLSARTRRRVLAAFGALLLLAGVYYGWFRDSSFVAVEDVTVTGVVTEDAARIRSRLAHAARQQSTLHVDEAALRAALPAGAAVADLRITTDFPHGMRIEVVQSPAVAVLSAPGRRVAVAADGSLLKGVKAGNVPTIVVGALPGNGRLGRGRALRLVGVSAAAPMPLRRRVERIRQLPGKGLVAFMKSGPQVILGDASSLAAKWAAAAAVLADEASRGASYVDVRIAERPVAGGVEVPQPEPEQPPAGATGSVPADPAAGIGPPQGTDPQGQASTPSPAGAGAPAPATPGTNPQPTP